MRYHIEETHIAWTLGGLALVFSVASAVLNVVFAYSLASIRLLSALRILLFVAFGTSLLAAATLVFFTTVIVQKLVNRSISFDHGSAWRRFGLCTAIVSVGESLSAITLIWLAVRQRQLPTHVLRRSSIALLCVWFALWGSALLLQVALFAFVGFWTKRVLRAQSIGRLDLDFGIRSSQMDEVRPDTNDANRSFQSQDVTLASPPRTPTTPRTRSSSLRYSTSLRHSSSTRVGPGSSRTKLVPKNSARSSTDSAFDNWDTSSVHQEMRAVLHSSPPVARGGLETIPGSRSVSPADALDGPFLPESPHATSSDTATALDWIPSSSPPQKQLSSSPPSSPPNFSRPTSRSYNKPGLGGTPMTELIHPLFRPNSPRPPPIAIAGTMVTASPMSGQPITPRTLARMRSNTLPQHWRLMPPPPRSPGASSTTGSSSNSAGRGSPGPSIADDEELPPILPGFVLSAGQRSSLLGYGRRKERPKSEHSHTSRRSMTLS